MAIIPRTSQSNIQQPYTWSPFRELTALRQEMDQLFDQLMPATETAVSEMQFTPFVEMNETEEAVHLKLEVPGMPPEDLNISVTPDSVTVSGERKSEGMAESEGIVRSEFQYGQFKRRIPLPTQVQIDKVQADYDQGIIHLILPKVEKDNPKVVKINVS